MNGLRNLTLYFYQTNKGIALILVVGVLALLALMGTAFTIGSLFEQKIAYNYVDSVRARYLAESGIAIAIAELKYSDEGARSNHYDTTLETWYTTGYNDSSLYSGDGGYAVSIIDCASQININDTNPNLAQILKNLNAIIGSPLTDTDCDNIVNNQPYLTRQMIKTVTGITQAKYNALAPYITTVGYIDDTVVNPQDVATPPFEFQPRGPINVNTASQQVIQALLTGLNAINDCPNCGGDGYINAAYAGHYDCTYCDGVGTWNNKTGDLTITSTEAQNLAQYLITNRPYNRWEHFYSSVKSFFSTSTDGDLVMANANPNTSFSWRKNAGWGDKLGYMGKFAIDWNKNGVFEDAATSADSGLTTNTTEFSFNSGGYYEITATGTFKNNTETSTVIVKLFEIKRFTTQADFEAAGSSKSNVQTYPEPIDAGVQAASYDGQIMLSKITHTSPFSGSYLRVDYLTKVNPDAGGGNITPVATGTEPNIGSVANFSNSGDLLPDGLLINTFSDARAYYYPLGNLTHQGTMVIWFKPRWNSNDTRLHGDSDQDKKMFRFTSGTPIDDPKRPGGYPFMTYFFWSDWGVLYGAGISGGGYPDEDPIYPSGLRWVGPAWFSGGSNLATWKAGTWIQIAFVWTNPADPLNPADYLAIRYFLNGVLTRYFSWSGAYYYHTPYITSSDLRYVMSVGFERDPWNGYAWELPNSIIGSVRIWDYQLSDNEIQADYLNGVYNSSGTFISPTFNPGSTVEWGTITWTDAIPDGISGDIVFSADAGSGFIGNWDKPFADNKINRRSNSVRFRAVFSASASPLIDTPVLEDITITYLPRTQILYWK